MKEEEIIEGNKLIAEFMRFKYKNSTKYWVRYPLDDNSFLSKRGEVTVHSLQFHSSWDWLMPVVEKCFKIGSLGSDYRTLIEESLIGIIDIKSTWLAVVYFIKWNNKQT